jgi:hypothetical protein
LAAKCNPGRRRMSAQFNHTFHVKPCVKLRPTFDHGDHGSAGSYTVYDWNIPGSPPVEKPRREGTRLEARGALEFQTATTRSNLEIQMATSRSRRQAFLGASSFSRQVLLGASRNGNINGRVVMKARTPGMCWRPCFSVPTSGRVVRCAFVVRSR